MQKMILGDIMGTDDNAFLESMRLPNTGIVDNDPLKGVGVG